MGLRFTSKKHVVALYDSVTDWAFGPVFRSEESAARFLDWAEQNGIENGDVSVLANPELWELWSRYCEQGGER